MSLNFRLLVGIVALAGALWCASPIFGAAQTAVSATVPTLEPGAELEVYLMTMGTGDLVWEKFGHNAIWIHDPVRGTDRVYNYGVFDFNSPGYWGRFAKGNWIYQLAVDDMERTLAQYRYFDRTVTVQELNLTPAEKAGLRDFLEWNARPENREYQYDYFRDNCSTRVRDVLDDILGGRLREATGDVPTGATYRSESERLIADDRVSYSGMIAGLGPAADRPISAWEAMFLPEKVQEYVRQIRVPDEEGRLVPLVRSERVIFRAVGRSPDRVAAPQWIPWYLGIGLALGALLLALGWRSDRSRLARWGFAALATAWALLIGTGGVILLGLWTLTDHSVAYRNENLLQFNPLGLALVILVPALAYGARWAARPALVLSAAVAALSVLGFALQVLPGFDQVNGEIIALALPAHLGLLAVVVRLWEQGVRSESPQYQTAAPRRPPRRPIPAR